MVSSRWGREGSPEGAGSPVVPEEWQAGRGDSSPGPVKPLHGAARCRKK